jgi:predicted MPP superfamily phosphohydrolase
VGLGVGVGLYARYVAPRRFEMVEADLRVRGWPDELEGIRLAFVADLHLGRRHGRPWTCPALEQAVEAVRGSRADLLVLGGDIGFATWRPEELALQAARFEAPQRVAVLGNHDHGKGSRRAATLRAALEKLGYRVLENQVEKITIRGRRILVAGLGDSTAGHANVEGLLATLPGAAGLPSPRKDWRRRLAGVQGANSGAGADAEEGASAATDAAGARADPIILVTHTPDVVDRLPRDRIAVALAGHTHGGQLAVPILNRYVLRRFAESRFDRGLYDVGGMPLYVTKGLGMVGFHARFRARPEAALLTIRSRPCCERA